MITENARILELLRAWSQRTISPAEEQELADWFKDNRAEGAVLEYIREFVSQYRPGELLPAVDWEKTFEKIQAKKQPLPDQQPPARSIRMAKIWWRRVAAAVIVFAIATTAIVMLSDRQSGHSGLNPESITKADVNAPETNKAMVTLADGRTVALDSLNSGLLAEQGHARLVKLADGQIAYQTADGEAVKEMQYNTLSNPRGSRVIDMALSDGSHVWLNAGSSVTYPVAFIGKERKVSISGEAYFEVAHNAQKPFYVTKGNVEVKVLGTHFNVNAYDDEQDLKVTLLEGSVKVSQDGNTGRGVTLRPGQQAVVSASIKTNTNVDIDVVMAWKNGLFQFDYTPMETVLKQLGRWYDIDVVYENGAPDIKLWGEMKRDLTLSQVLRGLGKIGVNFKIDGKKLVVMGK